MNGSVTEQLALGASIRRKLVAVIGDSRIDPGGPIDLLAEEVGRRLVDAGFRVLTGGMGGVMEAACRGAHLSANYRDGDTIGVLPCSDATAANRYVDIAIPTGLDHARNGIVAQADAVIAIGGGAGTLTEIAMAWIHKRLIVALKVDGSSGKLADLRVDDRIRYEGIPDDRIYGATTAEEAVAIISSRIGEIRRHSQRYKTARPIGRRDEAVGPSPVFFAPFWYHIDHSVHDDNN